MPFYDLHGCATGANFPMLLADWIRRKIGVIRQRNNDENFTFTLMMKKAINVFYKAYTETPIYPKCKSNFELDLSTKLFQFMQYF